MELHREGSSLHLQPSQQACLKVGLVETKRDSPTQECLVVIGHQTGGNSGPGGGGKQGERGEVAAQTSGLLLIVEWKDSSVVSTNNLGPASHELPRSHFYHGHDVSRAMVMVPPKEGSSTFQNNRQEKTCLQWSAIILE